MHERKNCLPLSIIRTEPNFLPLSIIGTEPRGGVGVNILWNCNQPLSQDAIMFGRHLPASALSVVELSECVIVGYISWL